ncbi:hypothetical protein J0A71_08g16730 [Encephalitozoon cuniculi]|nr:hypothetical protein J0A71_08g16730 [Encephalitozoon cuniculi]
MLLCCRTLAAGDGCRRKGICFPVGGLLPYLALRSVAYMCVFGDSSRTPDLIREAFESPHFKRFDGAGTYKEAKGRCGMRFADVVNGAFGQISDMADKVGKGEPEVWCIWKKRGEVEMLLKVKEYRKGYGSGKRRRR